MTQKQILFKIKGMQRDLSNSSFRSEYAFENMNLRITADTDNGLLSVTNEKGTKELIVSEGYGNLSFNKIYFEDNIVKATYPVGSDVKMECTTGYGTAIVQIKEGETWAGSYNGSAITRINILTRTDNTYFYGESLAEALHTYDLGYIIGVAEVDNKAVVFHFRENSYESCITLLSLEDYEGEQFVKAAPLYIGSRGMNNLNFSTDHPIETLVDIENENIQKVYWVDGVNQPRVINIAGEINPNDPKQFDFVPEINGGELEVEHSEASGQFPAGVIQYAFTYFNKYKQESAVVDVSPIYYIADKDKGVAPNETVNKSFKISFAGLDDKWEYIRLYSIIRTSINTTPEVRKVVDLKLTNNISYTDTGDLGEYIAPTDLLYKGGEVLAASTISSKDGTLFLGDIDIKNTGILDSEIKDYIKNLTIDTEYKIVPIPDTDLPQYNGEYNSEETFGEYYQYTNSLNKNSFNLKHFKTNESYRLGIQLQDRYGKWSQPIYIKDTKIDKYPIHLFLSPNESFGGNITKEQAYDTKLAKNDVYITQEVLDLTYNDKFESREFESGSIIKKVKFRLYQLYSDGQVAYYLTTNNITPTNNYSLYVSTKTTHLGPSSYMFYCTGRTAPDEYGKIYISGEIRRYYSSSGIESLATIANKSLGDIQEQIHDYWEEYNEDSITSFNGLHQYNIFSVFKTKLSFSNLDTKYIKVRPIIVYPEENEMEVICQGVLCPTVFNVKDRAENGPFVQSSWIFRPDKPTNHSDTEWPGANHLHLNSGVWAEYRHFYPIKGLDGEATTVEDWPNDILTSYEVFENCNGEINGIKKEDVPAAPVYNEGNFVNNFPNSFFVDRSIVTLHSPDIEFNNIKDNIKCSLRIIGVVPITSSFTDYYLSGPLEGAYNKVNIKNFNKSKGAFRQGLFFNSWNADTNTDNTSYASSSLWNLSNDWFSKTSKLNNHRVASLKFSNNNIYTNVFSMPYIIDNYLVSNNNSGYLGNYFYSSSIDKVIYGSEDMVLGALDNYDVPALYADLSFSDFKRNTPNPIHITYDSTKHIALELKESTGYDITTTLPNDEGWFDLRPFWLGGESVYISSVSLNNFKCDYGYLYLGELYRDIPEETKFGGTSEYALQNNLWLPAGKAVNIGEPIIWEEGDTYYQRYDCVKTLPRNDRDLNGVTDVLSFMCETRVNIDGRYDDRYKFVKEPLLITSDKINKLNEVYNQPNNFFNYRILDSERFGINKFPNTIVWSKTKQPNSIVDNWTNINLASSLDLDGNKGKVTSLKIFNDNIIAFQDKAISQVLFNSRVQLNTSDGVPIEISNSGKVDGKRYLSNNIGCLNKHSICDSTNGIYFIDDYNNSIYLFNGQFNNLSESKGFHSWMKNNSSLDTWDPVNFKNVVTYRDSINNEILFIYKDKCLVYNEVLGEFSSFYSYEDTPYMFTLKDKNILYNRNQSNLWVKNEGEYNNFFGTYKDFYTTIIANDNPTYDKIFSTLDFRADVLNDDNKMINSTPTAPFNYLKVVNEYQKVESNLSGKSLIPKFRVWRAQFPRLGKNRIRNTWATITLGNSVRNRKGINKKVRLHDMVVNYFV